MIGSKAIRLVSEAERGSIRLKKSRSAKASRGEGPEEPLSTPETPT